jgi:hypothetical protein
MSWATHFQAISSGNATASFGMTLTGAYSLAELKDLLDAKDKELLVLRGDAEAFFPTWQAKDPAAANYWKSDFQNLQKNYADVRGRAKAEIAASHLLPDNMVGEDGLYYEVLYVFNLGWKEHNAATDTLMNLRSRLQAAGAKMSPYTVPQPKAGTDFQQNVFKAADDAWKGIGDAAHKTLDWTRPIVIAATVVAGAVGFLLIKSYLPPPRNLGTLGARTP